MLSQRHSLFTQRFAAMANTSCFARVHRRLLAIGLGDVDQSWSLALIGLTRTSTACTATLACRRKSANCPKKQRSDNQEPNASSGNFQSVPRSPIVCPTSKPGSLPRQRSRLGYALDDMMKEVQDPGPSSNV